MTRLLRPAWLLGHLAMIALVVTFLILGWWQIGRAAHGNALSFGYSLEWPFFAAFVVFVWQREVRAVRRAERAAAGAPPQVATPDIAPVDIAPVADRPAGVSGFDVGTAMAERAARDRAAHSPRTVPQQGEPNG